MSVSLGKYILRAIPIVGPATLLLLAGHAFLDMWADFWYRGYVTSPWAQQLYDSLYRMGFGALLLIWVWGWGYVTALFVVERLIHRRKLPVEQRLSRRQIPGVLAIFLAACFAWCWRLSEMVASTLLFSACGALLVTSGLWLMDVLMSSPRTQHRDR